MVVGASGLVPLRRGEPKTHRFIGSPLFRLVVRKPLTSDLKPRLPNWLRPRAARCGPPGLKTAIRFIVEDFQSLHLKGSMW